MAEAGMIAGVFGVAVRAPHGFTPPPLVHGKLQAAYEGIVGAAGAKGKLIVSIAAIRKTSDIKLVTNRAEILYDVHSPVIVSGPG
jgi:hypothetical protein